MNNSGMKTLLTCPRKYQYSYIYGLEPEREDQALSIGTAFHEFAQRMRQGSQYERFELPDPYDTAMVVALATCYREYYCIDPSLQFVQTEYPFRQRLEKRSRHILTGTIDGITIVDGRHYLVETKTTSEDIGANSDYWLRLRNDPQIHCYSWALKGTLYDPYGVIYDVVRKPALKCKAVPVLDTDGLKIVTNTDGERVMNANGKPRQTGGEGMTVLTRAETPEEFEVRLIAEIQSDPERYFQRREVPVLSDGLEAWRKDFDAACALQKHYSKAKFYPRNISRFTCDRCAFKSICLQNMTINPACPPAGFTKKGDTE